MAEATKSTTKPKSKTRQAVAARAARAKTAAKKVPKPRVKAHASGFMDFVREQGVVGLAVGLAIGTAATVLVKSIVDNMINPVIGAILPGSTDLNSKYVCLDKVAGQCVNKLAWGPVVSNLISFLAVAAVIYFVVKGLKLDKLDKKKD